MIGRVVPKFLVGCSLFLALVLIVMSMISRGGALVASSAHSGQCSEVRCGAGEFSFTTFSPWGEEHPLQLGRVTPPENQRPVAANTVSVIMLDESDVRLQPTLQLTWWPPVHTTGTAYSVNSRRNLAFNAAQVASPQTDYQFRAAVLDREAADLSNKLRELQGLVQSTTLPSAATSQIDALRAQLEALQSQQRAVGAWGSSSPRAIVAARAAITYDRYALPQWIVIGIVLLPVWCAIALAIRHWRLRVWRRQFGICERCGYDLRGNTSGACPECGFGAAAAPPPDLPAADPAIATRLS